MTNERFKDKKRDSELTLEDKIKRTIRVHQNNPKFDSSFLDSVSEYMANHEGQATPNQEASVDRIYQRWNVGQIFIQGNYVD